jgi:hypothetical protein
MIEFELVGLNKRQQMLADIMWSLEEWDQVEAFINTLPKRERAECQTIVEMMKMAVVEQCYEGIKQECKEARSLLDKIAKR